MWSYITQTNSAQSSSNGMHYTFSLYISCPRTETYEESKSFILDCRYILIDFGSYSYHSITQAKLWWQKKSQTYQFWKIGVVLLDFFLEEIATQITFQRVSMENF